MNKNDRKALALNVLWCTGVGVILGLLLLIAGAGEVPRWAVATLGVLGFSCFSAVAVMHGWIRAPYSLGAPIRATIVLGGIAALMLFLCVEAWPPIRRHTLATDEITTFEVPLKAQKSEREEIIFACPAADENACVYATQFPDYFREAGWSVPRNGIERVTLGVAYAGIVIVTHADAKPDFTKPGTGVWVAMTPSLASVYEAFNGIGIEPDDVSDTNLPPNTLRIYVGAEKHNAAEQTQLTKGMETMKSYLLQQAQTPPTKP
jgi:hypothetical protein